jgi:hypothetical protein
LWAVLADKGTEISASKLAAKAKRIFKVLTRNKL